MVDSFRLKRDDIFLGKKLHFGESGQNSFVRIGQKSNNWTRPVHEVWDGKNEIDPSYAGLQPFGLLKQLRRVYTRANSNASGIELKNPLTHHTADTVAVFVDKLNFYTTINAQHLFESGTKVVWWHIIAYPMGKFFQNYVVKQGYRDGVHGFLHAMFMSFHSFLTRSKLWLMQHE